MKKKAKKIRAGSVKPVVEKQPEAAPEKKAADVRPPRKPVIAPFLDKVSGMSDKTWWISAGAVTAIAAFFRFVWLTLKPFHHDEGVNAFFLKNLINDGLYKYDPANYHGPTLYYIAIAFTTIFGYDAIPVRVSMDIFGLLMVVFVLFLRKYLGNVGSLVAGLFVALSPGMVYISRYFIHEILFVFLSIAIVLAVVFFFEKRKAGPFAIGWTALLLFVCFIPSALMLAAWFGGENRTVVWALRIGFFIADAALVYYITQLLLTWDEGRPLYLVLASASAALFFATKETAFITLGTMLIAIVCVCIRGAITRSRAFDKNWFNVVIAAHIGLALAALYYRDLLSDAYKWTYTHFIGEGRPWQEHFVYISIIFMFAAAIAAWVIFLLDQRQVNEDSFEEPVALTWGRFSEAIGSRKNLILIVAGIVTAFAYLSVLFFSSFFTYAEGVKKAIEAYTIWTKTGNKEHTQNGTFAYFKWMMKLESPIIIISAVGILIAMVKAKHRFAMFTALWGFGLFLAYTIIPYKTPWLALSFLLPLCMIAGYGINEMFVARNAKLKLIAAALLVSGTAVLVYQTYQANFVRYDDDDMTYVYAHTRRGFLELVDKMNYYADKSGKGKDAQIEIVTPDYWPMTWYVKDYTKAYFQGRLVDATTAELIVAKKNDQDKDVIAKYSANYKLVGAYPLRPGVDLVLLVRRDLADPNTQELDKIPGTPVNNWNVTP
jgi:uncharacterized protein (TIGR03663 family)